MFEREPGQIEPEDRESPEFEVLIGAEWADRPMPLVGTRSGAAKEGELRLNLSVPRHAYRAAEDLIGLDATVLVNDRWGTYDIFPTYVVDAWSGDDETLCIVLDQSYPIRPRETAPDLPASVDLEGVGHLLSYRGTPLEADRYVKVAIREISVSRVRFDLSIALRRDLVLDLDFSLPEGVGITGECVVLTCRRLRFGMHRCDALWRGFAKDSDQYLRRFLIEKYLR